jgi:hypothetical protein
MDDSLVQLEQFLLHAIIFRTKIQCYLYGEMKVKVKVPVLNKAPGHDDVLGIGGIAP